ncbi:uracil-DNA glycosylase [Thiothrix nivea]|uniref:Uracil-DNA glycosylase n=1 Tax=Thiothrix nivea (strain ATCC 35100 / DSM 5205 / JP2) TaxID=870187 RepID=A0A656HJI3_THINJ|nr:uracil-DNA glycosylase [Thiothrix nivea]EIJ35165.1 Uracil-DNA glycosylase [Thiothrix nivea DSM 5205]
MNNLPPSWQAAIGTEFTQTYMQSLATFLQAEEAAGKLILPPAEKRFNALQSTPLDQVRVVVLGQDPYPTPGHAHGLSFSVQPGVSPLPRSLLNINRELLDDLSIDNSHTGHLQAWAEQGVLLLNTVLTVAAGNAGSHQKRGWETFTDKVIRAISAQSQPVVFILWGNHAQKKAELIDGQRHHVIASAHPSPLSARRGFFGSKPFSRANAFLQANGRSPVNWSLPRP